MKGAGGAGGERRCWIENTTAVCCRGQSGWLGGLPALELFNCNAGVQILKPPPPLRNVFLFPSPDFTVLNDASARLLLRLFPKKCTFSFSSGVSSCELASRVYDIMLLMVRHEAHIGVVKKPLKLQSVVLFYLKMVSKSFL